MGLDTAAHARALDLLAQEGPDVALAALRDAARAAIDPELLNDLAVLALRAGDPAQSEALLRALVCLHPEHGPGTENLRALTGKPVDNDRRARFLQVVADARATVLPDNVDHLFDPWGSELPAAETVGERLATQLGILERCDALWEALGDDQSRELLLRFFAYRALGPAHVRLQLEPGEYRRTVIALSAQAMRRAVVAHLPGMPLEWQMHQYDLRPCGLPIEVIGPPLPLASTMAFSQYAYRDAEVGAGPQPGDVAIDAGGCWGDTALWLAHMVGGRGHVHTFEPTPGNRKLLRANLGLNPALAARVTVWEDPLGPTAGSTVWIPNVIAAGATAHAEPGDADNLLELRTQTIDALVASRQIPRVDFIKVDVEGADLGVLEGAADTIRTFRPRLAIACYHRPDDLVAIPEFIASLGAGYRWYLQCSTMTDVDTVAFALQA